MSRLERKVEGIAKATVEILKLLESVVKMMKMIAVLIAVVSSIVGHRDIGPSEAHAAGGPLTHPPAHP